MDTYNLKLNGYLKSSKYQLSFELLPVIKSNIKSSSNVPIDFENFVPLSKNNFEKNILTVYFEEGIYEIKDRKCTLYDDSFSDKENYLIIDYNSKLILETGRDSRMHDSESRHFIKKNGCIYLIMINSLSKCSL